MAVYPLLLLALMGCAAVRSAPPPSAVPVVAAEPPPQTQTQPPPPPKPRRPWASPAPTVAEKPGVPDSKVCLAPEVAQRVQREWDRWRRARLEHELGARRMVRIESALSLVEPRGDDVLVVGHLQGACSMQPGTYAMDDERRVHRLVIDYRARRRVTTVVCGCGAQCGGQRPPPMTEYVSAPAGATLGEPVTLVVPLEEDLTSTPAEQCPPMP